MYSKPSKKNIMTFKLHSVDDFQDFGKFIEDIELLGAHKSGLAKIIPPVEWVAREGSYSDFDVMNIKIDRPIRQTANKKNGKHGVYEQSNLKYKPMRVAEYKSIAESFKYKTPIQLSERNLEKSFWKSINQKCPIYGAGVCKTLTDDNVNVWNVSKLGTILDYLFEKDGVVIEGINTPYLYFGMWRTMFPWHTEDMDLYSINYLHYGYPKQWYAIAPEDGKRFEQLAAKLYPDEYNDCPAFLRHKMTLISPEILNEHGIPFDTITQYPGEFIINFPYGYHCGFNHGYNIAEAINFATSRWVKYGMEATECKCKDFSIKFEMDSFVRRFCPEQYDGYLGRKNNYSHNKKPLVEVSPLIQPYFICNKSDADTINDFKNAYSPIKVNVVKLDRHSFADKKLVKSDVWLDADGNLPRVQPLIRHVISNKIRGLINNDSVDLLEINQQYNILNSMKKPYCSLCLLLYNKKLTLNEDWKIEVRASSLQPITKYTRRTEAFFKFVTNGCHKYLRYDNLIRCRKCYLTIHKICYDISTDTKVKSWLCDRCRKNKFDIACAYCPLKIGIMKLFEDNVWAHVVCDFFAHSKFKGFKQRASMTNKLKCSICNLMCGNLINCSDRFCNKLFHVSCGILSGFDFFVNFRHVDEVLVFCMLHCMT